MAPKSRQCCNIFTLGIIYIAVNGILMGTTGFFVYLNYGWKGKGSDGSILDAAIGMAAIFSSTNNISQFLQQNINPCPSTDCPSLIGTGCIVRNDSCIAQPLLPCQPNPVQLREPCLDPLPCQNGTCRPLECPKLRQEPPIEIFLNAQHDSKSISQWLNVYPMYSANRLQVVTTLLDESIEAWVLAGFFHKCTDKEPRVDNEQDTHTCTFCQDRYDYIKCVMSSNITGQLYTDEEPGNIVNLFEWDFKESIAEFANTVLEPLHPPPVIDYIFDRMERAIRPFQLKTDRGECRICTDYSRTMYNQCFSYGKKYVLPGQRSSIQRAIQNEPVPETIL